MNADAGQARQVFLAAVKLPPEQWDSYLAEACGDDAELRQRILDLLKAHAEAGSFLESPALGPAGSGQPVQGGPERSLTSGEGPAPVIGPYKLLQQIGEGGMGVVYMAEQSEPIQRKVAVKIIKPGMDSRQVIARFEAERQALALMDHPNIAKVLDAGTVEAQGVQSVGWVRPYFVMELVKGVPITKYCDEHQLNPLQRLELFIPVCQALQHAHQKGIIHRDLKPSNVLVAIYDGRPVPKIIDFGVAKAVGQKLTERTMFTEFGQVVGTLEYMSPEQAEMNQLDVDTRSDIYSLGVLLYELLTGTTPLERKRLKEAAVIELLRIIREEEPPKPSTRLSTVEELPSIAGNRGMGPKQLSKTVRGELDWIVMKCLEKDRNRRYETTNGLAMDVMRYLSDEPVQACPPSVWYRSRKFARRNKVLLSTAAIVTLALVLGIVVSVWQAVRAVTAERRALGQQEIAESNFQKAREAVDKFLLQVSEDRRLKERDLQDLRKKLLQSAVPFYQQFIEQQQGDPARRSDLGQAYLKLGTLRLESGDRVEGLKDFEQMRAVFQSLADSFPSDPEHSANVARSYSNTGKILSELGQPEPALAAIKNGLAILEKLAREYPQEAKYRWEMARVRSNLAIQLAQLNRPDEALAASNQVLESQRQLQADFPKVPDYRNDLAQTHNDRGRLFGGLGRMEEALASFQEGGRILEELCQDFPNVAAHRWALSMSLNNQGIALMRLRRYKEALPPHERAFAVQQELRRQFPGLPEYRRNSASSGLNLANLLRALDRRDAAVATYDESVRLYEELVGQFPQVPGYRLELGVCASNRGLVLHEIKRPGPAKESFRLGVMHLEKVFKDYPEVPVHAVELGNSYKNLGVILKELNELSAGLDFLTRAIRIFEPSYTKEPRAIQARIGLRSAHLGRGQILALLGKHAEAVPDFDRGIELDPGEDRAQFRLERASCLVFLGRWKEAISEAEAIAGEKNVKNSNLYGAACVFSQTAGMIKDNDKAAAMYGARAVALLRQAVVAGFDLLSRQQKDSEIDPIRKRADFQQLLKELAAKAKIDKK